MTPRLRDITLGAKRTGDQVHRPDPLCCFGGINHEDADYVSLAEVGNLPVMRE
jgi:hypothetical protein